MLARNLLKNQTRLNRPLVVPVSRNYSQFETVGTEFDIDSIVNERASQDLLMQQPWSTRPFLVDQQLRLPVFNFISGNFTGDICSKYKFIPSNWHLRCRPRLGIFQ